MKKYPAEIEKKIKELNDKLWNYEVYAAKKIEKINKKIEKLKNASKAEDKKEKQ